MPSALVVVPFRSYSFRVSHSSRWCGVPFFWVVGLSGLPVAFRFFVVCDVALVFPGSAWFCFSSFCDVPSGIVCPVFWDVGRVLFLCVVGCVLFRSALLRSVCSCCGARFSMWWRVVICADTRRVPAVVLRRAGGGAR